MLKLLRTFSAVIPKPVKSSQLYDILAHLLIGDEILEESPTKDELAPNIKSRPLRILLAEDNEFNQMLELKMLEKLGYKADSAEDGKQALEALRKTPYDVVLMDVQMPEMDGMEATRRIHSEWPLERRPYIIAMTANAMKGDREIYLEVGMDDYISKPIRMEDIAQALAKVRVVDDMTSTDQLSS